LLCAGAAVVVLALGVFVVVDVAAFAIAAPPPTSAPVTAMVVAKDLRFRIGFTSLVGLGKRSSPTVRAM
jgi:hypothetical protein